MITKDYWLMYRVLKHGESRSLNYKDKIDDARKYYNNAINRGFYFAAIFEGNPNNASTRILIDYCLDTESDTHKKIKRDCMKLDKL